MMSFGLSAVSVGWDFVLGSVACDDPLFNSPRSPRARFSDVGSGCSRLIAMFLDRTSVSFSNLVGILYPNSDVGKYVAISFDLFWHSQLPASNCSFNLDPHRNRTLFGLRNNHIMVVGQILYRRLMELRSWYQTEGEQCRHEIYLAICQTGICPVSITPQIDSKGEDATYFSPMQTRCPLPNAIIYFCSL